MNNENKTSETLSMYETLGKYINHFKEKWYKWTRNILIGGLTIVFLGGILNFYYENKFLEEQLKIFGALQIWVGFALGIIATIFSIISMFLSFYNLELQKESEKENKEFLREIKEQIVNDIKNEVSIRLELIVQEMKEHFGILEEIVKDTQQEVQEFKAKNVKQNKDVTNFFDRMGRE